MAACSSSERRAGAWTSRTCRCPDGRNWSTNTSAANRTSQRISTEGRAMSRRVLMPVVFLVFALAISGIAAAAQTSRTASGTLVVADRDVANALDPDGPNAVYIPNIDAYVNTYDTLIQL